MELEFIFDASIEVSTRNGILGVKVWISYDQLYEIHSFVDKYGIEPVGPRARVEVFPRPGHCYLPFIESQAIDQKFPVFNASQPQGIRRKTILVRNWYTS